MSPDKQHSVSSNLNPSSDSFGLRRKTLQSSFITFGAQPIKLLIAVASLAILARLVSPADFGIIAMVMPLISLAESINGLGLGIAMVQQEKLSHAQVNHVFWVSLYINLGLALILLASTPLLVLFYQEPQLTLVVPVMAVGMMSDFVAVQPKSLLSRQMRFGVLTAVEVAALALGAGCALVAAVAGWGYWSLALQFLVFQGAKCLGYWGLCSWRPGSPLSPRKAALRVLNMLSYGAHLSGFHLINRIGMEMDRILIGYFNGAATLGFYAVAFNWAYFPFNQIYFAILPVAISSLSRAARDADEYRSRSQQILMLIFNLLLPVLGFLVAAGDSIMLILLGEQWTDAFPVFRVLVLLVFINSFYRVTKWIYVSSGQTRRQLRWSLIHMPVTVISAAIGTHWGALGVAWGLTLASFILAYPAVMVCLRPTPLSFRDFIAPIWRPTLATCITGCCLTFVQRYGGHPSQVWLSTTLDMGLFVVTYVLTFALLPGGINDIQKAYKEVTKMVLSRGS